MKPPPFAYARARTLAEVFDLLDAHGDEAVLLAGGQSLMAALNMRLSSPQLLIDINRLADLDGIVVADGQVRIGALARHTAVERSPVVATHLPLVARAMPYVAHPAIRNRGTFGGSLAFADPAAELPACAVALGGQLELCSRTGSRTVAAAAFYHGLYETARADDEVLVAARFPLPAPNTRARFGELARRHGDYAIVGLAAQARVDDGVFADLRLVFFGVGDRPVPASAAAAALAGRPGEPTDVAHARAALDADLDPPADLNGGPATKRHLARVLLGRVIADMAAPR